MNSYQTNTYNSDMMQRSNPLLKALIGQTVDALSFAGGSTVDSDFTALHPSMLESHNQQKSDVRKRVDSEYGPMSVASPDYLQRELLWLYRAETSSVENVRLERAAAANSGSTATVGHNLVDSMNEEHVRLLKKDMKQRIHEWEASFKNRHGREPGLTDKAQLRPVYEVYKVAKLRLSNAPAESKPNSSQPAATTSNVSKPANPVAGPAPAAAISGKAGGPSVTSTPATQTRPASASSNRSSASSAAAAPAAGQKGGNSRPMSAPANGPRSSGGPITSTPSTSSARPSSAPGNAPAQGTGNPPSSSSGGSNAASGSIIHHNGQTYNLAEITAEKKQLKRQLHDFEKLFETKNGRLPLKEDRREVGNLYTRYAELKSILQAHTSTTANNSGNAGGKGPVAPSGSSAGGKR